MDLHIAPGVTARQVAEAHLRDVRIQDNFLCKAITYWHDEVKGCVFCLIEAPDPEAVVEMHRNAHGLVPHHIIEVSADVVGAFLGRIKDPESAIVHPETKLKVFSDPGFRVIVITKTIDDRLLRHSLGEERTQELLLLYAAIVREQCRNHGGGEVYNRQDGFVLSFSVPHQAMDCAMAIRKKLIKCAEHLGLRMAVHAGIPVDKGDSIFGNTIDLAHFLCDFNKGQQIVISSVVRNQVKDNDWSLLVDRDRTRWLTGSEEDFMDAMRNVLATNWHDAEFDIPDFCRTVSVSKSQLYRKCIATTGIAPNVLLREYRLLRSLELLRNENRNISQTTFDTGFSSPSYFTKCFQKRFGLAPHAFLKSRG